MYSFLFKDSKHPQKPAFGVGFFEGFEERISGGILLRAAMAVVREQTAEQPHEAFLMDVLMKSVREMTYEEFQELEPFLFRYELGQTGAVPEVRPLKATEEEFERIRADPERFFLKKPQDRR